VAIEEMIVSRARRGAPAWCPDGELVVNQAARTAAVSPALNGVR
jgi:hypothetical protein